MRDFACQFGSFLGSIVENKRLHYDQDKGLKPANSCVMYSQVVPESVDKIITVTSVASNAANRSRKTKAAALKGTGAIRRNTIVRSVRRLKYRNYIVHYEMLVDLFQEDPHK